MLAVLLACFFGRLLIALRFQVTDDQLGGVQVVKVLEVLPGHPNGLRHQLLQNLLLSALDQPVLIRPLQLICHRIRAHL
jgi:hypothetical protein